MAPPVSGRLQGGRMHGCAPAPRHQKQKAHFPGTGVPRGMGLAFLRPAARRGRDHRCQISALYCAIVRSEEKYPDLAMFTSIRRAQAVRSS